MTETCGNCRFFRLNPMFAFPRVGQDNWCGEWEPLGEVPSMLAAIRAAEQDAEITPEIAAALEGERNRATVKPKALPPRAS